MDDTQTSIKGAEAAASRKRRSSILKSQRPPRTPLSELEFHVATPTDTGKSRRVSFSKRMGVAEFATNEATTTWKNFYEEHNKSLELSGNECPANEARPSIGHIGRRIFDQQFEEIEVIECGGTLQTNIPVRDFQSSLNNVNLAQQLTEFELECLEEDKFCAPIKNFELSSLPDQNSKVFGDDRSIPVMNEMSNPISINFSNIQQLNDKCDDLDEIQRDLCRPRSQVVCQAPFSANVSEYIEIDLNMTNIGGRNDDCNMSITDPIHSPVQAVSKNVTLIDEKKSNDEWVVDKENIAINPYATPKESLNFAINEANDKVLVFDGKKLRVQSEKQPIADLKTHYFKLPKNSLNTGAIPKRKNIVVNINDDLPNFVCDSSSLLSQVCDNTQDLKKSVLYNDCDLSLTQAVGNKMEIPKRKTIVFEDNMGNISITQAVPARVIVDEQEKRKTVIYENAKSNISITQPVPTNIIHESSEKRKTIVYEDDISFTQALTANLILNKSSQNKTVYYEDGLDISVTQVIPGNISKSKQVIENISNISMTQVIPSKILSNELKFAETSKSAIHNIDVTQGISENIMVNNEKRRTIVYDDNEGLLITEAIPYNIFLDKNSDLKNNIESQNFDEQPSIKRRTIIYDNEEADVSMTQVMPSNIIQISKTKCIDENNINITEKTTNERITNIYDSENGNVYMTEVISANVIQANTAIKNKTIDVDDSSKNVEETLNKRRTIIYDNEECDISVTHALPSNIVSVNLEIKDIQSNIEDNNIEKYKEMLEKRKTICDNEQCDISVTQAISSNIVLINPEVKDVKSKTMENNIEKFEETSVRRKTIIYEQENGDVSMTQVIPTNIQSKCERNKAEVTFDDNDMDISITRPLPTNILLTDDYEAPTLSKEEDVTINLTNMDQENDILPRKISSKSISDESKSRKKSDISLTRPIPNEKRNSHHDNSKNSITNVSKSFLIASLLPDAPVNQDILVYQNTEKINISRLEIKTNAIQNFDNQEYSEVNRKTINLSHSTVTLIDKVVTNIEETMEENKEIDDKLRDANSDKVIGRGEEDILNTANKNNNIIEEKGKRSQRKCLNHSTDVKNIVPAHNRKKSILSELLDMSNASLENIKCVSSTKVKISPMKITETSSSDSMFVVTDFDNELKIDNDDDNTQNKSNDKKVRSTTLRKSLEDIEEIELNDIQNKIAELKTINDEKQKLSNRHYEKILSSDLRKTIENVDKSPVDNNNSLMKGKKSIAEADNTEVLLEMLSELTDEREECDEKQENNKSCISERQTERFKQNTLSSLPKRQSIALSREDLLNNMSMAQAILQQSRFQVDESNCTEVTHDSSAEETQDSPEVNGKSLKKTVRMSTEVVKTLQFEDESVTNISMETDMKSTPLKKTTCGEITYVKDDKSKVIPTYLKDVSDGIKSLMHDLVKPSAHMPFDVDRSVKKSPSTCSTQIQANLITSSQIDIDYELRSNVDSTESMKRIDLIATEVATMGNRAVAQALRQSKTPADVSMEVDPNSILKKEVKESSSPVRCPLKTSPVIVFDHHNPLNNILLTQTDYSKVHNYSPMTSDSVPQSSKSDVEKNKEYQLEIERVSTHYKIKSPFSQQQSGDGIEKIKDSSSLLSTISKPLSIDRSSEGIITEVKDTEVNTLIVMKGNKDLLEANSSLTLVDDALDHPLDVYMEDLENNSNLSPVRVIYKVDEDGLSQKDSELTSNNDFEMQDAKPRKRSYSPTKQEQFSPPVDVTPKQVSKMLKMSNSPKIQTTLENKGDSLKNMKLSPKSQVKSASVRDIPPKNGKTSPEKRNSPKKRPDLTVQQLLTEFYVDASVHRNHQKTDDAKTSSAETLQMETVSETFVSGKSNTTFTSSKNAMHENISKATANSSVTMKSVSGNTKSLMECSSRYNVIAQIDELPFMGSRDCEWKSSSGDQLVFLLLRSRLRLTVRVAHAHHNTSRSLVPPNAPLMALTVDIVNEKEKEPTTTLCLRLAAEAMRYECSMCSYAGEVPALLQRCNEVARVAALWARVMFDARLRLAYSITPDGDLTLKVANIPLRSVWEVHMKIELVVDDANQSAWPRAGHVRVTSVLSDATPTPAHVARVVDAVKHDWGHAPTTLWKLFRYLKNKTRDEDLGFWNLRK